VVEAPNSSIAESYRSLRTSIMLLDSKLDTKTLMFTSAIPAEGKTFCTLNTAAAFAIMGKNVVVIDADLRRPTLHHALLGGEVTAGLSDYLSGQASLEEVLRPTKIPTLVFLSAGHRSTIPAELLASKEMDDLLVLLRNRFDRVIIDSAPIHAVSDSLILASKIPTTAMVIKTESTSLHAIRRAMHLLRETDTRIAGLILNRMKRSGAGYYYYYYYGRKYQDYRTPGGFDRK
jgi:capsular exopolysaccharide synthesis family protein